MGLTVWVMRSAAAHGSAAPHFGDTGPRLAIGIGPLRRSVCVPLVLGGGVRLRVKYLGAALRSGQKPEVSNDDTEVLAV